MEEKFAHLDRVVLERDSNFVGLGMPGEFSDESFRNHVGNLLVQPIREVGRHLLQLKNESSKMAGVGQATARTCGIRLRKYSAAELQFFSSCTE